MAVAGAAASPVGDETAYGGNEKIPPPKFDGTGTYEAVRAWFSDVGKWVAFMRARKHSEMAIVLLLDRAFTGEAETYRVLQNATGQWPTTPEGIANTVSERFRPKTAALTKRRELQQFRFQSGGTMEQHVAAFAALAVTVEQASAAELYSCFLASVPTNVMTLLGDGRLNPPSEDQNLRWSFMEQVYTRAIDIWGVLQLSNGFNMLAVHDRVQDDLDVDVDDAREPLIVSPKDTADRRVDLGQGEERDDAVVEEDLEILAFGTDQPYAYDAVLAVSEEPRKGRTWSKKCMGERHRKKLLQEHDAVVMVDSGASHNVARRAVVERVGARIVRDGWLRVSGFDGVSRRVRREWAELRVMVAGAATTARCVVARQRRMGSDFGPAVVARV
ncbi:hypothetical protein AMAG_20551 [Allomyces macrogynus ATCC 38327]|uniref:Retrotransposon gag domain-containing protein n=1 Tax=Allomyces macrogynus (strain ATCC 38327) TaxID=578462 RepID=A0A0L0TC86_ALLM3|nr:hypothetical protein AMAG_20551 [Allomyces macrogynus ATCC 38327]|eukprot:KNE72159.1 hypothetical protein AMAG_20551 [Allomyces macrogynus ATCC 38327]